MNGSSTSRSYCRHSPLAGSGRSVRGASCRMVWKNIENGDNIAMVGLKVNANEEIYASSNTTRKDEKKKTAPSTTKNINAKAILAIVGNLDDDCDLLFKTAPNTIRDTNQRT